MFKFLFGSQGRGSSFLRQLDRGLGIPLLWILGTFRTKANRPTQIEKIAVFKSTAIGDTVIMIGAIREIRRMFPQAKIYFVCGPSNSAAANLIPEIDEVLTLPVKNPWRSRRILSAYHFDVWLDFGSWPRLDALIGFLSNSRWKIGFRSQNQFRHYTFDLSVEHSRFQHEHENDLNLVRALQDNAQLSLKAFLPSSEPATSQKRVCLHLWPGGSQAEAKQWSLSSWRKLSENLIQQGYKIDLTGGPSDFEKNECLIRSLSDVLRPEIANRAGLSLPQTAELLSESRLVISVDTGVMHLASALQRPLIALHGPTHSRRWGPLNPQALALDVVPSPEAAPIQLGFENAPAGLMAQISVQQVLEKVRELKENKILL